MILNWNGARWLEPLLDSIVRQTCNNYEVILIDNASSDSSLELTRGYPWVRIAAFRQNLGYAQAYNLACTLARGEYLLLLNNDTVLAPDFVQEIAATTKDPQARLIAPMVTSYDGSGPGECGLNVDLMGYPGHDQSTCSFYVDGCALVIEAALFRALRGFDGEYLFYGEDVDLCWRAQLIGVHVAHADRAVVRHFGGGVSISQDGTYSPARTTPWKRYLGERNRLSNLLKNLSPSTLALVLPAYFAVNLVTMIVLALSGQSGLASTVLRVWAWHVANLPCTLRKRRAVQASRLVSDRVILSRMWWGSNQWRAFRRFGVPRQVSAPAAAAS